MKILSEKTIQELTGTYSLLNENCEDITFRMYDLFFSKYPKLRPLFPISRALHPSLINTLLDVFRQREYPESDAFKKQMLLIAHKHRSDQIKSEHLGILRERLLQAMRDVLFDDATPQMLKAWSVAYDCLAEALLEKDIQRCDSIE